MTARCGACGQTKPVRRTCRRCRLETVTRPLWAALSPAARKGKRRHGGRGLCSGCYTILARRGRLDDYPIDRTTALDPKRKCTRCGIAGVLPTGLCPDCT